LVAAAGFAIQPTHYSQVAAGAAGVVSAILILFNETPPTATS
jgi:hypothetical protein